MPDLRMKIILRTYNIGQTNHLNVCHKFTINGLGVIYIIKTHTNRTHIMYLMSYYVFNEYLILKARHAATKIIVSVRCITPITCIFLSRSRIFKLHYKNYKPLCLKIIT